MTCNVTTLSKNVTAGELQLTAAADLRLVVQLLPERRRRRHRRSVVGAVQLAVRLQPLSRQLPPQQLDLVVRSARHVTQLHVHVHLHVTSFHGIHVHEFTQSFYTAVEYWVS